MLLSHPRGACRLLLALLACFLLAAEAAAQDSTRTRRRRDPGEPSPPHERMAVFEGTWTTAPGAWYESGPAPAVEMEETCGWLAGGRRHMVCRRWTQAEGSDVRREAIQVLSYRDGDSSYVAHFAFPSGATLTYNGRIEGERWVMNLQPSPLFPASLRLRTIVTVEADGLRFVEEASEDGGAWRKTEDYRYRRVTSAR